MNAPRSSKPPTRWLHLRHPDGFDDQRWEQFRVQHRAWEAYFTVICERWSLLRGCPQAAVAYRFYEPSITADRRVITIPIGGPQTLDSRASIEDEGARLLWQFFPFEFLKDLESGLTEVERPETSWRSVLGPAFETRASAADFPDGPSEVFCVLCDGAPHPCEPAAAEATYFGTFRQRVCRDCVAFAMHVRENLSELAPKSPPRPSMYGLASCSVCVRLELLCFRGNSGSVCTDCLDDATAYFAPRPR